MTEFFVTPQDLGPAIRERAEALAYYPLSQFRDIIDIVLRSAATPQATRGALATLHQMQRLYLIHVLEIDHDERIAEAFYDNERFPLWHKFAVLDTTDAQKDRLAELMVSGDPQQRQPILLVASDYSREITERVAEIIAKRGEALDFWVDDAIFMRRILSVIDTGKAATLGELMAERLERVARQISLASSNVSVPVTDTPPPEITAAYGQAFTDRHHANTPNLFYTTTRLPTPQGAVLDGFTNAEYIDLFFRMCDVDWASVDAAHRVLIDKLDAGKTLQITNSDGTDITMDIDGFTFANSLVAKNVPGSEVFSAPHRHRTNGIIVAKGRFSPRDDAALIEDITLRIVDGKIVEYSAASGQEHLARAIETDEGSHYLGEIGIGTNPVLKQHLVNSLMVEKIGGSFHVAVGRAYEYKDYLGTPVNLDNGNRSKIHWDITTMLVGKAGRMILDGVPIMDDGKFIDPALAYLNGDA